MSHLQALTGEMKSKASTKLAKVDDEDKDKVVRQTTYAIHVVEQETKKEGRQQFDLAVKKHQLSRDEIAETSEQLFASREIEAMRCSYGLEAEVEIVTELAREVTADGLLIGRSTEHTTRTKLSIGIAKLRIQMGNTGTERTSNVVSKAELAQQKVLDTRREVIARATQVIEDCKQVDPSEVWLYTLCAPITSCYADT